MLLATNQADLIRCLHSAFGISIRELRSVTSGYSLIFKATATTGEEFAVLLRRVNKPTAELDAEQRILTSLAESPLPGLALPKPLLPSSRPGYATAAPRIGDRLVSVFRWLHHRDYDGSSISAILAFAAYGRLQQRLSQMEKSADVSVLAILRRRLASESISFDDLAPLLPREAAWADLYRSNLVRLRETSGLLQAQMAALEPVLSAFPRSLIHYDPTPANVGFDDQGRPCCIFDFDQCKWGVPEYDIPWMLWSFSAHDLDLAHDRSAETLRRRLAIYRRALFGQGQSSGRVYWALLLARFCLTLRGRLEDTYLRGFYNLRFIEQKIRALFLLNDIYSALDRCE